MKINKINYARNLKENRFDPSAAHNLWGIIETNIERTL